jgi:hypothetical protein
MKTNPEERKLFWEARVTVPFKQSKIKFNMIVFETTSERAKERAIRWAQKHVEDNFALISERIGYDAVMIEYPTAQVFRTSYAAVI